jgi:predicted DNA-binding transcriptional regulator AlpA
MDTPKLTPPSGDQLLRIQDVALQTTLSKSCINLWVAQNRFPRPSALSSTVKVWRSSDISAWVANQFEQQGKE